MAAVARPSEGKSLCPRVGPVAPQQLLFKHTAFFVVLEADGSNFVALHRAQQEPIGDRQKMFWTLN